MVFAGNTRARTPMGDMHEHRPLGIYAWFGYEVPIQHRLAAIRKAGFDTTSIWWGEKEGRGAELHALPAMVRDAGLRLDNAHLPFEYANLLWCNSDLIRQAAVEQHIRWLDECAGCGVTTAVMHLSRGDTPPEVSSQGLDGIREIIVAAEQRRMVVAVENVRSRRHLDLVLTEIESEHLAFCYDSSHDRLWNVDQPWLLRWQGSRLAVTHFSDNDGQEDRHWLPGAGVIDWQNVATAFPCGTYGGSICLEVVPFQHDEEFSMETFLAKARAKTQWLAGLLKATGQTVT